MDQATKDEYRLENEASVDLQDSGSFLKNIPQQSKAVLEKITAITQIIDAAVKLALQRTVAKDWIKQGDAYYLEASGVEKIRSVFGLYFKNKNITKETFPDGTYAYICSGIAGSDLLDQLFNGEKITVEIEGMRSSADAFFCGKDGNKPVDPMDVRKSAHANFTVRAAKALLGTGNYTAEDLSRMGVKVSEISAVTYQGGAEGGGNKNAISAAQVNRLMAIAAGMKVSDATIKEYILKKHGYKSKNDIERKNYDSIIEWAKAGGLETINQEPGSQG